MEDTLMYLITKFPDKDWYWRGLSSNPNIIFQNVLDNPDKDWVDGCSWYARMWN